MNSNIITEPVLTGSYSKEDCIFLLQQVDIPMLSVEEKELELQTGNKHYSEIISIESAPSQKYLDLFYSCVDKYKWRLASEILQLAQHIRRIKGHKITIVSLARAGTPIGVLLNRALKLNFDVDVCHYSISIVRDKGIDETALDYLQQLGVPSESIIFVDGWTAKGVITKELKSSISNWNKKSSYKISNDLCVISDIGGTADFMATNEDYTIPSGILNSTVSGLISRTILLENHHGFHQCVVYSDLEVHDLSNWFIDEISPLFTKIKIEELEYKETLADRLKRNALMNNYINQLMEKYDISDINKVKPGIAESTRVLLRRFPRCLIIRDMENDDISHLLVIAKEKDVPIVEDSSMPFNATAIIKDVLNTSR